MRMSKVDEFKQFLDQFESMEQRAVKAEADLAQAQHHLIDAEERYTSMVDYYEALLAPIRAHPGGGYTAPAEEVSAIAPDESGEHYLGDIETVAEIRKKDAEGTMLLWVLTLDSDEWCITTFDSSGSSDVIEIAGDIEYIYRAVPASVAKALKVAVRNHLGKAPITPRARRVAAKTRKAPVKPKVASAPATAFYGAVTSEPQTVAEMFPVAVANGYPLKVGSFYKRLRAAADAGEIDQHGEAGGYKWSLKSEDQSREKLEDQPVNLAEPVTPAATTSAASDLDDMRAAIERVMKKPVAQTFASTSIVEVR
jgi:hypothetical protein